MKKTKCFISYSHDSLSHKEWVKKFKSKILERDKSIIFSFDQEIEAGKDLISFMKEIENEKDSKIIFICTPEYKRKADSGKGGVAFETYKAEKYQIENLYTNRFIPIFKNGRYEDCMPEFLTGKKAISINGRLTEANILEIINSIKSGNMTTMNNNNKKNKPIKKSNSKLIILPQNKIRIKPYGYELIGSGGGTEGIRYLWEYNSMKFDSVVFNQRAKIIADNDDKNISAYTTSVSFGCYTNLIGLPCKFCSTGRLTYNGNLTANEIALQNIFMAYRDITCESFPEVRNHKREFAYMGQGEPGFAYPQIRNAIILTDEVMKNLNQSVHRHLISTVGIPEMIETLVSDIKAKVFKNRITLHFSLHTTENREKLIPVNSIYPFEDVLKVSELYYKCTGEKISIAILMFQNFLKKGDARTIFITNKALLDNITKYLNPEIHRINLLEFNVCEKVGKDHIYPRHLQDDLANHLRNKNFETKLFSSFGSNQFAGCGLLESNENKIKKGREQISEDYQKILELMDKVK
jgi:adenine C2-methylase RlmN of 23S rRNA A2503 and tRNA A37